MTPVERAARALAKRDQHGPGDESRWPDYVDDARAVLQAIRDPSEGMVEAARRNDPLGYCDVPDDKVAELYTDIFEAMIDAALSEEEAP